MVLKRCSDCGIYSLNVVCRKCGGECVDIGYKFKLLRDAPKDSASFFFSKRKTSEALLSVPRNALSHGAKKRDRGINFRNIFL